MTDKLNAVDLATVSCTPVTPYQRGREDCEYQGVYCNPYPPRTWEWWEYDAGHHDARERRNV